MFIIAALDKSAEDEEPAAKVPTRASRKRGVKQAVAPAGVVWEWEGDGGWTAYDTNLGKKITEAFLQKENQLVLQVSVYSSLHVGRPFPACVCPYTPGLHVALPPCM